MMKDRTVRKSEQQKGDDASAKKRRLRRWVNYVLGAIGGLFS